MLVRVALCALLFASCSPAASDTVVLRLEAPADRPLSIEGIRYEPADNVIASRIASDGGLVIERRDASRALTVHVPELCPVTFASGAARAPVEARPVIDLGLRRSRRGP